MSAINIWMRLTNARDDAFLTQLVFLLDTVHFNFIRIEPRSVSLHFAYMYADTSQLCILNHIYLLFLVIVIL